MYAQVPKTNPTEEQINNFNAWKENDFNYLQKSYHQWSN